MKKTVKNKKTIKDVFGAYLVDGALLDGYFEIPFLEKQENVVIPDLLISYTNRKNYIIDKKCFLHFYINDNIFDGMYGLWNYFVLSNSYKKGFDMNILKNYSGIICPDYSLYNDMPRAIQIYNIYKSRTIGFYLKSLGFYVVPNIRWTDKFSYDFCFSGIEKNSVLAIGTLGCSKTNNDKTMFIDGFVEMIERLKPSFLLIYGSVFKEMKLILNFYKINYKVFKTDISTYYGDKYGNESK